MPCVVAENLWRMYGETPALQGLNMEVEAGSAYGFIGPNGAGKSTTLRLLATLDQPDAGRIEILGQPTTGPLSDLRRRLGFMPDPFNLLEGLTVEQLLSFYAGSYGLPRGQRKRRVERAIELTRIAERRREPCQALSKGWRQRVYLAKTLVHDPQLLLLDEPAAGLDPAARIDFRAIVRTLRDLGKTIIVSSHILTELADYCDAVGIIAGGRMLVSGKVSDILSRLNQREVVELTILGEPAPARAWLKAHPQVAQVDVPTAATPQPTHRLGVQLKGKATPELQAALLEGLIAAGVRVCSLTTRSRGLEELFLQVAGQLDPQGQVPYGRDDLRRLLQSGDAEGASDAS